MMKEDGLDPKRVRLLMLLCLSTLGTVAGFAGALPAAAVVMERQGFSASIIGSITGLVYAGVLCMVPFQPWVARRFNMMWAYQTGSLVTGSGFIGLSLAHSVWAWAAATFLIGLGAGLTWPVTDTLVASMAPADKKGTWTGLFQGSVGASFALGPFIASGLSSHDMFLTAAALTLVPVLALIGRQAAAQQDSAEVGGLASFWQVARLAPELPLLGFIGGFLENGTQTAVTLTALGLDWKEEAAIALAGVIGVGALASQYPAGRLADAICSRRVIFITLMIFTASCLPLPLAASTPSLLWWITFFWGAAGGSIHTLSLTMMAQRFTGSKLVASTTLMVMAYTAGGIAGPAVAGCAVEYSPLWGPMILFTTLALLGMPRRPRAAAQPADSVGLTGNVTPTTS